MSSTNTDTQRHVLQVSELTRETAKLLESSFDTLWVEGEITNFSVPKSGHWYFALKDEQAQIKCVMFRGVNSRLNFTPEEGMAVLLRCSVSLYEPRGDFQLIGKRMEIAGDGALRLAFEQLYKRLSDEGLFAEERKRPLPEMINHIGLITSPHGAVIHDVLTVLGRRWPLVRISLLPVTVQGDSATGDIIDAIHCAARYNEHAEASGDAPLELLLLARGGGAPEDLQAFNDEELARAVATSPIIVVAGIGHESDITIAHLAADVAASTPSAAAELISPNREDVIGSFHQLQHDLTRTMTRRITDAKQSLRQSQARLQSPERKLQQHAQRLDEMQARAQRAIKNLLLRQRQSLELRGIGRALPKLQALTNSLRVKLDFLAKQHRQHGYKTIAAGKGRLSQLASILESLSPLAVIGRGFTVLRAGGEVITSVTQLKVGQTIDGYLHDGAATAEVKTITPGAKLAGSVEVEPDTADPHDKAGE